MFYLRLLTSHVIDAARRLNVLDERQIAAVAARIELDLRLGASFTRFQSFALQPVHPSLDRKVISYGVC